MVSPLGTSDEPKKGPRTMTPKSQSTGRKSAEKVAVEASEIKAVLVEQRDFLQPVVQEAVQAILEMEMEEC